MSAHSTWSGRPLTCWEWAFLEFHRLHDEVEADTVKRMAEGKLMNTVLDLAVALKTGDFDDANSLFASTRHAWFGELSAKPDSAQINPDLMTFRNISEIFSYDSRLAQDDAYPDDSELVDFINSGPDDAE